MSEVAHVTAGNDGSFSGILGHTLRIVKQHWAVLLILVVVSVLITLGIALVTGGGAVFVTMTGSSAAAIPMIILFVIAMIAVGVFVSLSTLKVVHLTVTNKQVAFGEVLSYGFKNFLSFIWTSIVGTVYALKWALLLVFGMPALWAIMNVMRQAQVAKITEMGAQTPENLSLAMESAGGISGMITAINFIMLILGFAVVIYMVYMFIRINFLGYAFVADEKRGVEAAKTSMELVDGRWWKTFGYFFLVSIILQVANVVVSGIIGLIAGEEVGGIVNGVINQFATILTVIFSALLYGAYKKSKN